MRTRVLALALLAAGLSAATPAIASPVKCKGGDITVGDRIFPEPNFSFAFLRFDEFECAIAYMERRFPNQVEVTTIGTSAGGHPLYDVLITNEAVTTPKRKLLIINSIHGDEAAGREGGTRFMEDLVDARFLADEDWVKKVMEQFVVHFVFPNPDGWVAGDVIGSDDAGPLPSRTNEDGVDLNRELPVHGWVDVAKGVTAEGRALKSLFDEGNWYLGTDNHGQLSDEFAAAGLQIVGEFDYQKSETIARFGNGINETMKEYEFGTALGALEEATDEQFGPYHWGTLYDMLGYSAAGSGIDYYNTPGVVDGTGFATEITAGKDIVGTWGGYPPALSKVWVDAIRAINVTMLRQSVDPKTFTFPVGSDTGYLFDPKVIAHDDENGPGFKAAGVKQAPYSVTRMKFFDDLNDHASAPVRKLRVESVNSGLLSTLETLVIANGPLPEDPQFYATLREFVEDGGNLVLTDAALKALGEMGVIAKNKIAMQAKYVGAVHFLNRTDALNQNLRGVASQTFDTVPIGYRFGSTNSAPNWSVERAAWEAAQGRTAAVESLPASIVPIPNNPRVPVVDDGTSVRTTYGEMPLGKGRIRILGALLPDPTEAFDHRYGLQNYAVTYTGYTLLENMLKYERPAAG